jgi:myo-inositol-1(or 4)-monophosphatase
MIDEKMRKVIREAGSEAAAFILENAHDFGDARFKGRVDMVTKVDLEAEKIILDKIRDNFPDHNIITEESKNKETASPYRWIIDPLDGTTNFVHSFPFVSVSIALEYNEELALGVVNNPFMKEYFFAEKGTGAYLNGEKITVSNNKKLKDTILATGFPYDLAKNFDRNMELFSKIYRKTQGIRRAGSAAIDLCYVACGRFDGFWEFALNPWDVAAGALMVQEAGGKLSDFSDKKLNIFKGEIMATNGLIHRELLSNF